MPVPPPDRTETLAPRATPDPDGAVEPTLREPTPDLDDIDGDDPDRYEQVAEHARGGLGRVVRAVDKRLGRTVAVKELLRRDASHEALFMREALITARLEHPGIVPVHEAGRWPNGDPYYTMKLVEGRTLKELIAETETVRERLALLPHVIAIADAVGYAHSEGVIHRDLKPSNVIIGAFGETIVVDWGLARDRHRDVPEPTLAELTPISGPVSTVSGKVVGTPAYMSPEQARGELVDERADVYAIGAVLYEMLAGAAPHATLGHAAKDETPQMLLDRVIAGPPTPVHELAHSVPSELATIVAKAMEREPDRRYPNARALAEDLRRYQTGKLVSAHSYTMWSLFRRKLAQNRGVVGVAIASALALGAVGVESFRRVVAERNVARIERDRADGARGETEHRQRELVLIQANTSLRKDPTAALAWLKQLYPKTGLPGSPPSDTEREQVVDIVDEARALGVSKHVFRTGDWVYDALFTPDGKTVVSTVRDGTVRAFDLPSGRMRTLGHAPSPPEHVVLSKDGNFAITGGITGEVIAWPLAGGKSRTLASGAMVRKITAAADGMRFRIDRNVGPPEVVSLADNKISTLGPPTTFQITVADEDWTKQVARTTRNQISVISGNATRTIAHTDRQIDHISLSPNGDTVVFHDGSTVWAVPFTGGQMRVIAKYDKELEEIKWSPDRKTVAIVGHQNDIPLVDIATGTLVRDLHGHTDALYNVQFTRDGKSLLSASDDGTARMWSIADGTSTVMAGHDDDVYRARLSADERQVATASLDGSVRVWKREEASARSFTEGANINSLSLDGNLALVVTPTAVARWNLVTGERASLFSWAEETHSLGKGWPSEDGKRLVVPSAIDSSLEVRSLNGPTVTLRGHTRLISAAEFGPDGSSLYSGSADGSVRRWDLATGQSRLLWDGSSPVIAVVVSPDGHVYGSTMDQAFKIDPDGAMHTFDTGKKGCFWWASFDKLAGRMLMQRCDMSLALFDHDSATELDAGGYRLNRYSVSANGQQLAGAMADRVVRLWSIPTGRVLNTLRGHSDLVINVAFSPDGRQLASTSYDKTIRVWDLASNRHRVLRGHSAAVNAVAWRSATQLVSGSTDGTLRLWDVPAIDLPATGTVANELTDATSARIDESDRPTSQGS